MSEARQMIHGFVKGLLVQQRKRAASRRPINGVLTVRLGPERRGVVSTVHIRLDELEELEEEEDELSMGNHI